MREILNIDGDLSIAGSDTDFRISLDRQVEDVERISLLHCSFPYTFFLVGEVEVDEGSGSFTLELPQAYYTQATLAGLLQSQFNSKSTLPQTYSVSWNPGTYKYTISAPGSFTLRFGSSTGAIHRALGFSRTDAAGTSLTSDNVSMVHEQYLMLDVQPLPTNVNTHTGLSTNFILPLLGNWGDFIQLSQQNSWRQWLPLEFRGKDIKDLRITLRFRDGTQVPSLNGGKIHLVFAVFRYQDSSPFWRKFYEVFGYE